MRMAEDLVLRIRRIMSTSFRANLPDFSGAMPFATGSPLASAEIYWPERTARQLVLAVLSGQTILVRALCSVFWFEFSNHKGLIVGKRPGPG